MLDLLKNLFQKKETQELKKDSEQEIEDVILKRIKDKIHRLEIVLDNIRILNIKEAKGISQEVYENQIKELNELLISMNYILDIFAELKNYVMEYIKEILKNQYISENSKRFLIEQLQANLQKIRKNVERIFVEIEVFTENLKY
jgi:hypothetical protein